MIRDGHYDIVWPTLCAALQLVERKIIEIDKSNSIIDIHISAYKYIILVTGYVFKTRHLTF